MYTYKEHSPRWNASTVTDVQVPCHLGLTGAPMDGIILSKFERHDIQTAYVLDHSVYSERSLFSLRNAKYKDPGSNIECATFGYFTSCTNVYVWINRKSK